MRRRRACGSSRCTDGWRPRPPRPRTSRVYHGHQVTAIAIVMFWTLGVSTKAIASDSSSAGKARKTSVMRMITWSIVAAEVARDQPQRDPDQAGDQQHLDHEAQRDPRAVHDPRQQVAADQVGAERVRRRRAARAPGRGGSRCRRRPGRAPATAPAARPARSGPAARPPAPASGCGGRTRACGPPLLGRLRRRRSSQPDPGVDGGLGDVDQQVEHDVDDGHDQRDADDRRACPAPAASWRRSCRGRASRRPPRPGTCWPASRRTRAPSPGRPGSSPAAAPTGRRSRGRRSRASGSSGCGSRRACRAPTPAPSGPAGPPGRARPRSPAGSGARSSSRAPAGCR